MADWFECLFGTPEQQIASEAAAASARAASTEAVARKAAQVAASELEARNYRALRPHCNRCGGSGYLPSFSHIRGGACFACN